MTLPPALFPPVSWFIHARAVGRMEVGISGFFEKQTGMSRYTIAGSNSLQNLIVPVQHTGAPKLLRDTQISRHGKWVNEHVRALKSAYGKAPFFEFYDYKVLPVLEQEWDTLLEMIQASIAALQRALLPECELIFTENKAPALPNIETPAYPQVFDDRFEFRGEVSALDLLFNLGPEAEAYLTAAVQK
jgi:hypothetical protein